MTIRTPALPAIAGEKKSTASLRLLLWLLHVWVVLLALLSLVTGRFDIWVDLRALGITGKIFALLWALCAAAVPFLAGPRLIGFFRRPRWAPGLSSRWAKILLWPTYALLACLLADTVEFAHLFLERRADLQIPLPFLIAALLSAWVLLTRQWLRRGSDAAKADESASGRVGESASSAAPRNRIESQTSRTKNPPGLGWKSRLFLAATVTLLAAFMTAAFALHTFERPPPPGEKIDLAVVLGGYVLPDSSASVQLADRTRVAITLYRQGTVSHILLSGGIHPGKTPASPERNEITAMKNLCLAAGIPESALFYDPVGINTRATAFNTRELMRTHGFSSVIVCSTDFHLYRTVMSFHQAGVAVYALAAQPADWPCAEARDTVREMIGIAVYQLFPHYHLPTVVTMQLSSPHLVVNKSAGTLEVFDGDRLVKTYACITGTHPGDKQMEGDRRTPEGRYRIVYKNPESNFHLSLGLDYPNEQDAQRGLAEGAITREQYDAIIAALASDLTLPENQKKLWYTKLGGELFIHGHGTGRPDTAGCVALANKDIEELYAVLPIGTPVEILP